ncbi:MAG: molecular chaperone DnaK (HSP70) [Verrucomicrobiales bacterium]|jgi:molecular chaperone DnaK (HSP70)
MSDKKFTLGIDLGTSNCALSVCDLGSDDLRMVDVIQALAPNKIGPRETLPSAAYLAHESEFPAESTTLPWGDSQIIGHFAREHGSQVPDRLVLSAKSWLSNTQVDPRTPVLPFMADLPDEEKISALDASTRYLNHLREAFLHSEQQRGNDWTITDGLVVITVPASFDETARKLTLEAAAAAGLGEEVVLLEEPQAAFYAWTAQEFSTWKDQVQAGDCVLVCDLGGGTADFSLIAIKDEDGDLAMERVAVGEHLLLGGDNMDIGLAYALQAQLEAEGKTIDEWQLQALTHACRAAKVKLFADPELDHVPVAIPSRGASLIGGSISTNLDRTTLESMILDGFFPLTPVTELPVEQAAGLQDIGLPYASDPVISKHLARFLTRSLTNLKSNPELAALVRPEVLEGDFLKPDAILFNGGVFKSEPVRQRTLELLKSWNGNQEIKALEGFQLDLAVALGACYYGRTRATGEGIRIKAGTARSYYIGLESSAPAIPGFKPPVKALCVVPQGMEEGSEITIDGQEFALTTGKEATFRFFMSEVRSGDQPGQQIPNAEKSLEETSALNITLDGENETVPVKIQASVTELGNLELWMKHTGSDQRWKLELELGAR